MKRYLKLGSVVMVLLLGFALQTFAATTATPVITSVTGGNAGYINLAGSSTVSVVGTITASTSATTTVLATFYITPWTATSTGVQIVATGTTAYSLTVNASNIPAGTVSVSVVAKTGLDASSTAAATTTIKDVTPPTLSNVLMYTNNAASTTVAKLSDIISLMASSSKTLSAAPTVVLFGHSGSAVTVTNPASNGWKATTTVISSDSTGAVTFSISGFSDLAGNPGATVAAVTSGIPVNYYGTGPAITIGGQNPQKCNVGWSSLVCADAGATAVDALGNSVTLSTLSTVNLAKAGNYTISYGGVDSAGNAATSTRTVVMVNKTTSNVVVLPVSQVTNPSVTNTTSVTSTTTTATTTVTTTTSVTANQTTPTEVPTTVIMVSGVSTTVTRHLNLGLKGNDVKLIQTLLSKDSSVYPEGLITGYFGSLTKAAIQRFQVKYGIVSAGGAGYGEVGPKTKAKLVEIFGE